ncbi:hypothetical protein AALO_G00053220 [Alosa alosa]|uniref:Uncharacterized protein n=1 Tax=Alosa alosa TaxID=278164 RepID=A0AAV6H9V0_9TELE|nr:hypothetical protein AALO_G00053220 [Alosa alosa]
MATAVFYTRSLQELPKLSMTDVHCICNMSKVPSFKMDKGFRLYVGTYIHNYEGVDSTEAWSVHYLIPACSEYQKHTVALALRISHL